MNFITFIVGLILLFIVGVLFEAGITNWEIRESPDITMNDGTVVHTVADYQVDSWLRQHKDVSIKQLAFDDRVVKVAYKPSTNP